MIVADLAELYGVPTRALNQAVKRNAARFPGGFVFQLTADEKTEVVTNCNHLARLKFSKVLPFAFTEHGNPGAQCAGITAGSNVLGKDRRQTQHRQNPAKSKCR